MPAPDIALETGPDGRTETIADIRRANPGKPILVNLWATWCAPCLGELPTLDRLAAETKGRLVVVPVSQDLEGWRAVSKAFTPERYPNLTTRVESRMAFGAALGLPGLPATVLYDAEGREIWRYIGDFDWASPEARALIGLSPPETGRRRHPRRRPPTRPGDRAPSPCGRADTRRACGDP